MEPRDQRNGGPLHVTGTNHTPTVTNVPRFRVLIIGKTGVGKSSLVNLILGQKFLPPNSGGYGLLDMKKLVADPKLKLKTEDDMHVESDEDVGNDDKGDGEEEEEIRKVMTEEQEMEEGKRMFSMFAARMFQQRVLQTYREKVAQERQQQLLRELEDEDRLRKEQKAKKRMRKQEQRQRKLAKKAERTARAAKKAVERAAMEAKQRVHEEEMLRGNEEERPEHAVARKAAEEEKRREGEKRIQSMFPGDMRMHITRDGEFAVALGGFADIYRGTIHVQHTEIKVAIKTIKVYSAEDDYLKKEKRLQREVQVWMKLNHANVLSLYGTTSGFGPLPSMVCPWLENGTLTSYLERCCANPELHHVLALVHDVASGLQYLHSQSIVHGDLSGSNVLIHANGRACISDFGLSMVLDEIRRSTSATTAGKPRGTLRWAAPELLDLVDHGDAEAQHTRPTIQSDIYAFGSIMLQILSGKVPYYYYSRDLQIVAAIFRGEMPMRPDNPRVTDRRWEFIRRCWSPFRIAVQRPSSEEIVAFSTDMVSLQGSSS